MQIDPTDPIDYPGGLDPVLDVALRDNLARIIPLAPPDAARLVGSMTGETAAMLLTAMNPGQAQTILAELPPQQRQTVVAAASPAVRQQWARNERYPDQTVGQLMEPPLAVFSPETTVAEATTTLRHLVTRAFITYAFAVDSSERLVGVVAMREMLLARPDQPLSDIMIKNPFFLAPEDSLLEAMKATVVRHFPVYPVCEADGKLVGLVRGQMLFEAQAIELSAQAGSMVGVEREERLSTPLLKSLTFRHPWLQLNLLTAFLAAAVVGAFEGTLERIVLLAVFLPVLAGQSGNTGCQALAVALRGITLGELKSGKELGVLLKEAALGCANGALVGLTAGLGMFFFASTKGSSNPAALAAIVFTAMTASCVISGVFGALVPMVLKRLGADPATASSIFVTTATDVASMGIFLGLATLLL
jgi:magnesium transporter